MLTILIPKYTRQKSPEELIKKTTHITKSHQRIRTARRLTVVHLISLWLCVFIVRCHSFYDIIQKTMTDVILSGRYVGTYVGTR